MCFISERKCWRQW